MQMIKNIALFAGVAAALPACPAPAPKPEVPAVPKPQGIPADAKFGLIAIRSGSPIQSTGITASKGSLLIGGNQNDASCDAQGTNFATFFIKDGAAFLYAASATPQQLWVDRSGMGQGVTGYTTGAQPAPRNAELTGFSVNAQGNLVFDGKSPKACPSVGGAYSLWFTDAEKPAFQDGCIGVALKAVVTEKPVGCAYSSS